MWARERPTACAPHFILEPRIFAFSCGRVLFVFAIDRTKTRTKIVCRRALTHLNRKSAEREKKGERSKANNKKNHRSSKFLWANVHTRRSKGEKSKKRKNSPSFDKALKAKDQSRKNGRPRTSRSSSSSSSGSSSGSSSSSRPQHVHRSNVGTVYEQQNAADAWQTSAAAPGTYPAVAGTYPAAVPGTYPTTVPGTDPAVSGAYPAAAPGTYPAGSGNYPAVAGTNPAGQSGQEAAASSSSSWYFR